VNVNLPYNGLNPNVNVNEGMSMTARDADYWKNFSLIAAITFLAYTSNFFFIPFLPVYMTNTGYAQWAIGLAVGAFSITSVFLRPLVGGLMDCWPRRLFVITGSLVLSVLPLFYPWTHGLTALVLLRILHGVGISLVITAGTVIIADIAPPGRLSQSTGHYMSSVSLALIVAPIAAGQVMGSHPGSFWPFVLWPAALAVPALAGSLFLRETRCTPAANGDYSLLGSLRDLSPKTVWVPTVSFLSCQVTQGAIFAFVPVLTLGWSYRGAAGIYFAVYGAVIIAVRILLGHLADRHGRHKVVLPTLLLSAAGTGLLFWSHGVWLLVVSAVVYGVGYGLAYPGLNAFLVDHVDERKRGAALGLFATALGAGTMLGPVMAGLVTPVTGVPAMFLWLALAPVAGALLFALAFREAGLRKWPMPEDSPRGVGGQLPL